MDESLSQSAIHGSCLNFRVVTPVCPVHGTEEKHLKIQFDNWKSCDSNWHFIIVPLKPLTLSVDPLQLRKAHQSYQRSESCNAGLTSEPLLLHLDLSRSNTGYQPPSPPLYLEASSVLWSVKKSRKHLLCCSVCSGKVNSLRLCTVQTFDQHYLQVGDPALTLPSITVRVGVRGGWWWCGQSWKLIGRDAACMPVGPEDAVGFYVQVHRINTHTGITLKDLLIAPVGHTRIQAADFIVVSYVENLSTAIHAWKENRKKKITKMALETNNYLQVKNNSKEKLEIKKIKLESSLSALQVPLILVKYLWQLHL